MKEERYITYPETGTLRWFILMTQNRCADVWYFTYNICSVVLHLISFKKWR